MEVVYIWTVLSAVLLVVTDGEYILNVSNSGPACIDSEMTFHARLHTTRGDIAKQFVYVWITNVFYPEIQIDTVIAGHSANLTKLFTQYEVHTPAQYRMDVRVFNLTYDLWYILRNDLQSLINSTNVVSRATNNFSITDFFHVTLDLNQNFTRHKNYREDVFVGGHPIILTAAVVENFVLPSFTFCWLINDQEIRGPESKLEVIFSSSEKNFILLYALANVSVTDFNGTNHLVQRKSFNVWKEPIVKDLVTDFAVTGKQTVFIGEEFEALISCNGSSPFNISWNLTALFNNSDVFEGEILNIDSCNHSVSHRFSTIGIYVLSITVENPVDLVNMTLHVSVSSAMTTTLPNFQTSAAVPVLGVAVAVVCAVALMWSYARSHKSKKIETADFEFYSPVKVLVSFHSYGSMGITGRETRESIRSTENCCGENETFETVELKFLSPSTGGASCTVQDSSC